MSKQRVAMFRGTIGLSLDKTIAEWQEDHPNWHFTSVAMCPVGHQGVNNGGDVAITLICEYRAGQGETATSSDERS
jgi:hypothetical protein